MADDDISLMKAMIFVVAFSALFAFIFAYTSPVFSAGDPPESNSWLSRNFDPSQIADTTFWECDGFTGYNVTSDFDWNTYVEKPGVINFGERAHDGDSFEFTSAGNAVQIFPMATVDNGILGDIQRNMGVSDSFLFYQEWGWWDHEWDSITFLQIVTSINTYGDNQQAKLTIDLKEGMTVWFLFPAGSDVMSLLESGSGFTVSLGQSTLQAVEGSQNIWNALTGIITFNIDTGIPVLNYLISLPIWICIAYITFSVVTRIIPGL